MLKISDGDAVICINGKDFYEASIITDVPNDFLEGFTQLLRKPYNHGVVITACLDPANLYLVLSRGFCEPNNYYEITDGSGNVLENFKRVYLGDVDYIEMAKELIEDIESDFDNWSSFYCCKPKDEKLRKNIEDLKDAIDFAEYKRSLEKKK